ncbi:MAG: PQQ-binding-like beta-propeller repeat protein, partial [Dongiaceae bacterium]
MWAAQAPQSGAGDWSQFRGNPQLTGVAASAPPAGLKLLWTYETGEPIESSAAIADGAVYVGSTSGDLLALDLESGRLRWKYRAKEGIGESSPAVRNGVVVVGDLAGVVHAISARDGKPLWTYKTGSEVKSSPVILPGERGGPQAGDDRVLIGSYDEHLYCLAARTGALLWKAKTEGPVHCTPAVAGGVTFVSGCDERFRAVQVSTGKELYQIPFGAYAGASPALAGDFAYFGNFANEVVAINLKTRRIAWRYKHPRRNFPFYSSAAVVGDRVVLGGRDKIVHCLNARTGKALWTFTTRARVESSPAVAGGRVYIGSNDGNLYVLDLATGKKLWEFTAGAPLSASPAIAAGRLVIGSHDGRLY